MILFSVRIIFSLVQTATTITSETLLQPDDRRFTQLVATHYDCSKQYNLRQSSLTRVQKCNKAPSETEYTRIFALVFIRAKAK